MRILPPDTRHQVAAGIALLTLSWSAPVLADCVDTRQPTAAEREFHSRAMAAIANN